MIGIYKCIALIIASVREPHTTFGTEGVYVNHPSTRHQRGSVRLHRVVRTDIILERLVHLTV
jgi:hypothetical protein